MVCKWKVRNNIGVWDALGTSSDDWTLVGHQQAKLKMHIDNETRQVEKFQAYYKGNANWGVALEGGILATLRVLRAKKDTLVECETPAREIRETPIDLLEQEASVYEGHDKVLSYEERESLENRLLQLLPIAEKEDLTITQYFGNTPLHYAARLGLVRFAQQLIPALSSICARSGFPRNSRLPL